MATQPIIRLDGAGVLDEFIAAGADIHFERMADAHWWIGVTLGDGRRWMINVGVEGGAPFALCEEG